MSSSQLKKNLAGLFMGICTAVSAPAQAEMDAVQTLLHKKTFDHIEICNFAEEMLMEPDELEYYVPITSIVQLDHFALQVFISDKEPGKWKLTGIDTSEKNPILLEMCFIDEGIVGDSFENRSWFSRYNFQIVDEDIAKKEINALLEGKPVAPSQLSNLRPK